MRGIIDTKKKEVNGQIVFGDQRGNNPIQVFIGQFYGIEINDLPEHQRGQCPAHDWEGVVPKAKLMGNPPFVGARLMDASQKDDVNKIFSGRKNAGNLDYVSCWYKKATDVMTGTFVLRLSPRTP